MRLAKPWISALALVALLAPLAASAGDGVVEINQARALAGAGPGDPPGFPVTLRQGSYRLTSDLLVPPGTNGIEIVGNQPDAATIDLNGFQLRQSSSSGTGIVMTNSSGDLWVHGGRISGFGLALDASAVDFRSPVRFEDLQVDSRNGIRCNQCQVRNVDFVGNSDGIAIEATGEGLQVIDTFIRRGLVGIRCGDHCFVARSTLRGFGANFQLGAGVGIEAGNEAHIADSTVEGWAEGPGIVCGEGCTVRRTDVTGSAQQGIVAGRQSVLQDVKARANGGHGIEVGRDAIVSGCMAVGNGGDGITTDTSATVIGNNATRNGGDGIDVQDSSRVVDNVVNSNQGRGIAVGAGSNVTGSAARGNAGFALDATGEASVGYAGNVFSANNAGNANPQVSGGLDLGGNLCGTTAGCP